MPDTPHRVFFALWPDAEAVAELSRLADAGTRALGGRAMRADSLHLTLAFIGEVDAAGFDALRAAAGRVRAEAFEMTLDQVGAWRNNRILWAGCREAPYRCRRLFEALARELRAAGFALEKRPYLPHVTLARKLARLDGTATSRPTPPIRWRVREFALVESRLQADGARYRIEARWPLAEGPGEGGCVAGGIG